MFVFFNSRMGCLGSLMTSLVVTLVLIALVGGFDSCGSSPRGDGGRAVPSQDDGGSGGGDF